MLRGFDDDTNNDPDYKVDLSEESSSDEEPAEESLIVFKSRSLILDLPNNKHHHKILVEKSFLGTIFTISIVDALSAPCCSEKGSIKSGGGGPGNNPQTGIKTLPKKHDWNRCVCSLLSTKSGGKRTKSRTACVKCGKGIHSVCFDKHKCRPT